jgi:yeast amino acid transporter
MLLTSRSPTLLGNMSHSDASASPFVIAIDRAGISGLPSVINAVILIAAWSAGNSDMYAASRTLHALALEGKAPAIVRKCTKGGLPYVALIITGLFGFLAYLNVKEGTNVEVFNWLYNVSSITGLIAWSVILGAYLQFYYGMKRQGLDRNLLAYKAPFQPYLSWFGFIFINLVILFNGYAYCLPFHLLC